MGYFTAASMGAWCSLPMYRVSPDVFVTREHIISDRASTSSSFLGRGCSSIDMRFSSLSLSGSGDVSVLRGVDEFSSWPEVACEGEVGLDCAACEEACRDACFFSASFFSNVPKSVAPSSSPRSPVRPS